ncbi:unnamed protein product [Rotaria sp. Silwood2]|nr:unnamed protein product [Rotaria sp. Silwood2]CAF2743412.1 unnamed protein product [Rotaria sp. Silwood2]CAF3137023.1 unnamed protein product [Rotaria sp. Silwood2]CAF4033807.1 unnamed protein product [Rotaria sp. Silwood2]CAF4260797.1 unnamed protein product [Rotaria sp. Silwood2]
MLLHNISVSDVRPGDHLYQWRKLKLLQGIAVQLDDDAPEIYVVMLNKFNKFDLVTLNDFKGKGVLRRVLYDQGDSRLHRIKLSGTSYIEKRRPAKEIVQNALLLLNTWDINAQFLQKIFIKGFSEFAKLCCTINHDCWRNILLGQDDNELSIQNSEQEAHFIVITSNDNDKIKELENNIEILEDKQTCPICMERFNDIAFLCGHLTCFQCSQTLNYCHICGNKIDKKIKIFWS